MNFTNCENKNKFDHGIYSIVEVEGSYILTNSITGGYEFYKSFQDAMRAIESYEIKAA